MRRPIVSTSERIFDLSKEWHILFARGHVYDSRYNYANGRKNDVVVHKINITFDEIFIKRTSVLQNCLSSIFINIYKNYTKILFL